MNHPAVRLTSTPSNRSSRPCASRSIRAEVDPVHERDVESDELVRGWEVTKGHFVVVEDAELEAIEQRDTSRSIEIGRFVGLGEVDPVYFDRTYYLVPAGTEAARRPYVLLLAANRRLEERNHEAEDPRP